MSYIIQGGLVGDNVSTPFCIPRRQWPRSRVYRMVQVTMVTVLIWVGKVLAKGYCTIIDYIAVDIVLINTLVRT